MESYKREVIQFLEKAGVLKFGDFTAKSGRKIPYFINAGEIKTGKEIATLGEFYARAYREKLGQRKAVLYGPAYKGISIAVSAAVALSRDGLDVPFFFNRKEAKDHGEGGLIVGAPLMGRVLIVDDVITAGTAIRETMRILAAHDATPAGVVIALDRRERGQGDLSAVQEVERAHNIAVTSIVNLDDLVVYLAERPEYAGHLEKMRDYRARYGVAD